MALSPALDRCRFWVQDPAPGTIFTDAQIQEFLDLCKTNDADGYSPGDDSYTDTYDVLRAAGYGWLWMAGQVANKSKSYRIGDVWVEVDKDYCRSRARDLMGSTTAPALRRDEDVVADTSARRSSP